MRVPGIGGPRRVLAAVLVTLAECGLVVEAAAPIIASDPLGPSRRRYANGAVIVASNLAPPDLLGLVQGVERVFGRSRRGARWRARPLDIDIVLWSGGLWSSKGLAIPHPEFRRRDFVLDPATAIAARWRDPRGSASLAHLHARLTRPSPLPRSRPCPNGSGALSSVGRATDF